MIKFIKAAFLAAVLSFSTVPAMAAEVTIDVGNYPTEQVQQVATAVSTQVTNLSNAVASGGAEVKKVADVGISSAISKAKETVDTINSIDTSSWAEKGAAAGEAVVNFTSKLGIATVDFITSGTGLLLSFAVLMYFFGYKILGIMMFAVTSIVAYKLFGILFGKREQVQVSEKIDKDGTVSRKFKEKVVFNFDSGEYIVVALIIAGILSIPSLVILSIVIF